MAVAQQDYESRPLPAFAQAHFCKQVHRPLLQYPGADPFFDVFAARRVSTTTDSMPSR